MSTAGLLALLGTYAVSHIGGELIGTVLARYGLLGGRTGRIIRAARLAARILPLTGRTVREPDELLAEWLREQVARDEPEGDRGTTDQTTATR